MILSTVFSEKFFFIVPFRWTTLRTVENFKIANNLFFNLFFDFFGTYSRALCRRGCFPGALLWNFLFFFCLAVLSVRLHISSKNTFAKQV